MTSRLDAAIAAIDAANADDPHTIVVAGKVRPKEQAHAELMTAWVRRLDPDASEAQLLAARAHHLRRWSIPRAEYPEGRAGYLQWRTALGRQHAEQVAGILGQVGYDDATVARVQDIIRKRRLRHDDAVQTHEDALCLVFLETQFDDLLVKLGRDKTVDVVAKTLAKMSEAGKATAAELALAPELHAVLADAVSAATARAPESEPGS